MIQLHIKTTFSAAHGILIRGEREPLHGHDWHVTIVVEGTRLDEDGLLLDFHELERSLEEVVAPFRNQNLNETAPFDEVNPTAEHVAIHLGERIATYLPEGVSLVSASVTEAPGCLAVYRPDAAT